METIKVNNKTFVIKKCKDCCSKCLFNCGSKYPDNYCYCLQTFCSGFIVIREANVIDKIKTWLKKKIKK